MMSTSCIIMPASKFRDTKTSFFNQTQASISKVQSFQQRINELETTYSQLDDRFENEIIKNVELKA